MDDQENLTKKERRELRREERKQEHVASQKKKTAKKIIWWVLAVLILFVAGYGIGLWAQKSAPEGADYSQEFPITSWDHIQQDSIYDGPQYVSNPPTSGPHWPVWVNRGIYEEELQDEMLVHNLEHGEIWISYHPRVPAEVVAELASVARRYNKTVMVPRSKNDTDIALAAWGRLDKWNLEGAPLDKERVENFIKRYINQGRELVP